MLQVYMLVAIASGFTAAMAIAADPAGTARGANGRSAVDDLRTLAHRPVFFGHQSVGLNVIDGLRQLAAQDGIALRVAEVRPGAGVPPGTFAHGFLERNGAPRQKLQSFERAFDSGAAAGAEIALLKFCYVDFTVDTDAAALFREYQATIARLQGRHPGVVFVHVTVPLVALPGGLRSSLAGLLGRPSRQLRENARRDEYNALLRRAYDGKEPIFDLARVESLRPDGGAVVSRHDGREVPALFAGYTDDGGHLNAEGRLRAARELAAVLAAVP